MIYSKYIHLLCYSKILHVVLLMLKKARKLARLYILHATVEFHLRILGKNSRLDYWRAFTAKYNTILKEGEFVYGYFTSDRLIFCIKYRVVQRYFRWLVEWSLACAHEISSLDDYVIYFTIPSPLTALFFRFFLV